MPGACILGRIEHSSPRVNLYLFPHSGGMPGMYIQWKRELPRTNVFGVQYPGRGSRMAEAACRTLAGIVEDTLAHAVFQPPFVLMGHSLGALVAYEVAARLEATPRRPSGLIVSAMSSPAHRMLEPGLSKRSADEILADIGTLSPAMRQSLEGAEELKEMFVRVLRSDLEAVESYAPAPRPPLSVPIAFLGGEGDSLTPEVIQDWARYTAAGFQSHLFPGGHFYFEESRPAFFERLNAILEGRS